MLSLTENQRKTVATGATVLALTLVFAFVALVAWGILKALAFVSPAIIPVMMGFFLALFFKPYYRFWVKTVKNPTLALVVMLMTLFIPLGIFIWYAGSVVVEQITNLIAQGPQLLAKVMEWFRTTFPRARMLLDHFGVPYEDVGRLYTNYGGAAMKAGSSALKCLSTIVTSIVSLIFFVFFLMTKERTGGEIVNEMPFLKDDTKQFVAEQIDAFVEILVSFFQRQTVICIIEGCFYGAGFSLVGVQYGFIIGFVLGILNLIPLFGSILCMPVAMPLAYFGHGGSLTRLILVLAVWGAGQLVDGYILTPRIQGDKTGLGYAGVIFSFFFWATVLGPVLGMLLAIPLSAFCTVLWRALKSRYIKPVV